MRNIITYIINNSYFNILVNTTIIIILTIIINKIIIKSWSKKHDENSIYFKFIEKILVVIIHTIGIIVAIYNIPQLSSIVSKIIAGSGLMAVVIGLAAQEALGNLINGVFIALFHPFEVGDRVRLLSNNMTGYIEDITLRHTVLRTFTNSRIIIPNSTLNKEMIENSHFIDSRSSSFIDVCVAYESDLKLAMSIITNIISNHALFVDNRTEEDIEKNVPVVKVFLRELGDSGVWLRASMWTNTINENFEACSDIRLAIKESFEKEGIEIPYKKIQVL